MKASLFAVALLGLVALAAAEVRKQAFGYTHFHCCSFRYALCSCWKVRQGGYTV